MTNKVWDEMTKSMMCARKRQKTNCKRPVYSAGEQKFIYAESNARNEQYLEYEWNGHQFSKKQKQALDKSLKTVSKHCKERYNRSITDFDCKVAKIYLFVMINSLEKMPSPTITSTIAKCMKLFNVKCRAKTSIFK